MKTQPTFGLVCAGGGAHGSYQVGVLKYIHEKFCHGRQSPFQIFTGASCGGLNTTFYGAQSFDAHASRLWLEELWLDFHVPAYHGNLIKNAFVTLYRQWQNRRKTQRGSWALLDPGPMRRIIERGLNRANLERSIAEGTSRGVAIAATELLSGRACWFQEGPASKTWNLYHSIGMPDLLTAEHLAASCSVPIFLPPVKLGRYYFVDGSVSLDRPLSAAILMGATRILSIATDKPFPVDLPSYDAQFSPRLTHVIRLLLNRLSHDAARDEAVEIRMLNRFYGALSRRARKGHPEDRAILDEESQPDRYQPVELCLFFPSKRIRQSYGLIEENDFTSRRKTRFLFHEKFIRELINLGYDDARSRHEELSRFFTETGKTRRWFLFSRKKHSGLEL